MPKKIHIVIENYVAKVLIDPEVWFAFTTPFVDPKHISMEFDHRGAVIWVNEDQAPKMLAQLNEWTNRSVTKETCKYWREGFCPFAENDRCQHGFHVTDPYGYYTSTKSSQKRQSTRADVNVERRTKIKPNEFESENMHHKEQNFSPERPQGRYNSLNDSISRRKSEDIPVNHDDPRRSRQRGGRKGGREILEPPVALEEEYDERRPRRSKKKKHRERSEDGYPRNSHSKHRENTSDFPAPPSPIKSPPQQQEESLYFNPLPQKNTSDRSIGYTDEENYEYSSPHKSPIGHGRQSMHMAPPRSPNRTAGREEPPTKRRKVPKREEVPAKREDSESSLSPESSDNEHQTIPLQEKLARPRPTPLEADQFLSSEEPVQRHSKRKNKRGKSLESDQSYEDEYGKSMEPRKRFNRKDPAQSAWAEQYGDLQNDPRTHGRETPRGPSPDRRKHEENIACLDTTPGGRRLQQDRPLSSGRSDSDHNFEDEAKREHPTQEQRASQFDTPRRAGVGRQAPIGPPPQQQQAPTKSSQRPSQTGRDRRDLGSKQVKKLTKFERAFEQLKEAFPGLPDPASLTKEELDKIPLYLRIQALQKYFLALQNYETLNVNYLDEHYRKLWKKHIANGRPQNSALRLIVDECEHCEWITKKGSKNHQRDIYFTVIKWDTVVIRPWNNDPTDLGLLASWMESTCNVELRRIGHETNAKNGEMHLLILADKVEDVVGILNGQPIGDLGPIQAFKLGFDTQPLPDTYGHGGKPSRRDFEGDRTRRKEDGPKETTIANLQFTRQSEKKKSKKRKKKNKSPNAEIEIN